MIYYIFQQLNHNNDYILSKRRHFVKKASEETCGGWGGGVWLGIKEKGPKGMGVVCLVGWL